MLTLLFTDADTPDLSSANGLLAASLPSGLRWTKRVKINSLKVYLELNRCWICSQNCDLREGKHPPEQTKQIHVHKDVHAAFVLYLLIFVFSLFIYVAY